MATQVRPVDAGPYAIGDPWDWGVDQVVAAICHRQTALLGPQDFPKEGPPPDILEAIIRDNSIGGLALLKDVDNKSMREDLGISRFGHRSSIAHLIYILRWQSPKYLEYIQKVTAESRLSGYGTLSNVEHEHRDGSHYSDLPITIGQGFSTHGSVPAHAPLARTLRIENWVQGQNNAINNDQRPPSQSSQKVSSDPSMPPPLLPPPTAASPIHSSEKSLEGVKESDDHRVETVANQSVVIDMVHSGHIKCREGETLVVNDKGEKRRKLFLAPSQPLTPPSEPEAPRTSDPASSMVLRDNKPHIPVDRFRESNESNSFVRAEHPGPMGFKKPESVIETSFNTESDEAGVLTRDSTGRKRMKPILISQSAKAQDSDTDEAMINNLNEKTDQNAQAEEAPKERRARLGKDTYSGLKAFPVDGVFYGHTPLGQPINHEADLSNVAFDGIPDNLENFVLYPEGTYGSGQRLYVSNRIKYFLSSSSLRPLDRRGKSAYALIPYSDKLVKKHQPLSLTEFVPSSDGYVALRGKRSDFAVNGLRLTTDQGSESNLFNVSELPMDQGNLTAEDPEFLEKWKYQDEDEVLPLFGDSGSEGEYDLKTWYEMELEQGKLARPPPSHSKSHLMDNEDVKVVVDNAIENTSEEWKAMKLPKLQRKAWQIWMRSRKDGSKKLLLHKLTTSVKTLDARLANLKTEILKEAWSSAKQVIKQCKILQPSIFDMEESKWRTGIIGLKEPPERPQQTQAPQAKNSKAQKQPIRDDEEVISDGDESTSDSTCDDLSDFIVNDDDAVDSVSNDEVAMADVEDEGTDGGEIHDLPKPTFEASPSRSPGPAYKKPPLMGQNKRPLSHKSKAVYIDLTQASDPTQSEGSVAEVRSPDAIHTPPLNAQASSDESGEYRNKKLPGFRRPPVATEVIDLESDSNEVTKEEEYQSQLPLPDLTDVTKISQLSPQLLEERQDRKRLLLWIVNRTPKPRRQSALKHIEALSIHDIRLQVWEALRAYKNERLRIPNCDIDVSDSFMLIAAWFVCWTIPVRLNREGGIRRDHINTAFTDEEGFEPFCEYLISCLKRLQAPTEVAPILRDSQVHDSDVSFHATPTKKRKHMVEESQEARQLRVKTRNRVQERERRAKAFSSRLQQMGRNNEDPKTLVINPGKTEDQDFIYLNEEIGQRIQPHQREGVQFMWRELTGDSENLQGCLLAHTMGLGKTMQVITVLVTIAEAAESPNKNIRRQVPKALRQSRTLILCPPSLVENWYEEFLTWAPSPTTDNIGRVRKITSAVEMTTRVSRIEAWSNETGVLLLGFTTFRDLITNRGNHLSEAKHRSVVDALLVKPTLVVADEAHTAKNLKSQLNIAINRVRTKSRIALTGSPLANNIEEYYALIDWIAPNYLGDHIEFKARYAEPIQQGTYKDCSEADYIESRKILKALQSDLEPKVHRADLTVLKGKLKGKTEFLIKLPLTELQMELYTGYVDWMLGVARVEEPETAVLWAWLGELRLLCNHPKCFADRLQERLSMREASSTTQQKAAKKNKKPKANVDETDQAFSEEDFEVLTTAENTPQASTTMMRKQLDILKQLNEPIVSVSHALKMQVLEQILTFAREATDKTLVFSHSIKTLDYIGEMLNKKKFPFIRIDGTVITGSRQSIVKNFNTGSTDIGLISTKAGGQGLNMFGANRVVIIDTHYNPIWEEQAIGRAYRLGQKKPVFVYRLTVGGTFEEALLNQAVFKQQLATRVVDKRNPLRYALKGAKQFLFHPRSLEQKELDPFFGKDSLVLDRVLDGFGTYVLTHNMLRNIANGRRNPVIRSIELTETFQEEDTVQLTAEEERQAQELAEENQLRRRDPVAYNAKVVERARQREFALQQKYQHWVQGPRHRQSVNGPGLLSSITANGNQTNPPDTPSENAITSLPYHPASSAIDQGALVAPTLPNSSNITPVLGVNTTIQEAATLPSETGHPDVGMLERIESERLPNADSTAVDGAQSLSALNEQPKTVSSTANPSSTSVEAEHQPVTPLIPPATNNSHSTEGSPTHKAASPNPGNALKRKRSPSPPPNRATKPKGLFGFPALNGLWNRETSRNGEAPP